MTVDIPDQIEGFASFNPKEWSNAKYVKYDRKKLNPTDVVIKNIACGLCGSDIHTIQENWGSKNRTDLVVGHEVIGHVIAVGTDVKDIKIGDRVGLGAATSSCGSCSRCKHDNEQYCPKQVSTYNSVDVFADGYVTQGGYSSHSIANQQFVFPIPEGLETKHAAPLMCAGLTVYSPLVRNVGKDATGKTVGVIGIGGLGHLAIQFARALGAEVYAFSRSSGKKNEALKMGAHGFIATNEEKDWDTKYFDKFDFIINCASRADDFTLNKYLSILKVDSKFLSVGLPTVDDKFDVSPFTFLKSGGSFGSSLLGSKTEVLDMLEMASSKGVKPWVEEVPISEEGVKYALERCDKGDIRYRFVFTEFDKAFSG